MHLDKYVDSGLADLVTKESKPKIKKEAKVVKETKELKIDSKETKDATD